MSINGTTKFDELCINSRKTVSNYVRMLCRDFSDAEDITQEAYVRAFRFFHTFDQRSSFDTWVKAIARNQYIELVRRRQCRPLTVSSQTDSLCQTMECIPDVAPNPEASLMRLEVNPNLVTVIRSLNEIDQLLLKLIILEQRTCGEVALRLEMPLRTVNRNYNRALNLARSRYQMVMQVQQLEAEAR